MTLAHNPISTEQRSEDRLRVRILATIIWWGEERGVVIDNLASRGALLSGSGLPDTGTEVVLKAADYEIVATVAWSTGTDCGLSFHRAIDPDALHPGERRDRHLADWITRRSGVR